MYIYSKNIYFPNKIKKSGYLEINNGIIEGFSETIDSDKRFVDYSDYNIIPGFIDQHLHGWGTGSYGRDLSGDSIKTMKSQLPSVGVTSFLATSGAAPIENLCKGIYETSEIVKTQTANDGATCLGVHLEGPFVNEVRKGMMAVEYFKQPSVQIMEQFVNSQNGQKVIRLMTMAPELEGSKAVIEYCKKHDIQINIGHSDATFETIANLKEFGLGGVTHMFSGMRGFHHRELGVAGAALYFDDLMCEFAKQTGWTVKPEAFELAYKIKGPDRIIMTTDNGALALVDKERYHYTRKQTFIPMGDQLKVVNDDGTFVIINRTRYEDVKDFELSYLGSIKNLIKNVHPSIHEVIKMTSENCAKYINVYDRKGSLEVGKDADFLVIDNNFNLKATYCMGVLSYEEKD